jgi:hypothetical protein
MYEKLLHLTLNNNSRLSDNGNKQYAWTTPTPDVKQQVEAVS